MRPGDLSLGSLSLVPTGVADAEEVVAVAEDVDVEEDFDELRDFGSGERTCLANPGRGSDMGSVELRRCDDSLTGASEFRFSGLSSKSGVPGLLFPAPPSSPCSQPSSSLELLFWYSGMSLGGEAMSDSLGPPPSSWW